jgi:hypothetical protein
MVQLTNTAPGLKRQLAGYDMAAKQDNNKQTNTGMHREETKTCAKPTAKKTRSA